MEPADAPAVHRPTEESEIMKRQRQNGRQTAYSAVSLLCSLLLVVLAPAFRNAEGAALGLGGVQKGFKAAEFFGPPNETRMQSLLKAETVQPYSDKLFLLSGLTLQTYRESGEAELLVKAPQCLYNQDAKSASSAGPLRVTTADGKFSIEGEGFSLLQTNSSLVISNRVWTVIDPDLLNPQTNSPPRRANQTAGSGIEIRASHFQYSGENGIGVYQRKVRVTGSNDMSLTCEKLSFELPFKERQLKNLNAEQEVVVDHAGVHATAQRALYSTLNGLIRMQGNPAWRNELREGRGDELVIDRTNKIFRAEGHAWVSMPAQGLSISSLVAPSNSVPANGTGGTNQFVEVASDFHEFRTNRASFGERVLVTERVANQPRGTMSCGHMEVTYTGSNQLQTLVADRSVVIQDQTNQLSGARAIYTGTNGVLELTGNPSWVSGERSGKGDLISVNTRTNEMLVRGYASMRLPAGELSRAANLKSPNSRTNAPAQNTTAKTNEWAEVESREYTLAADGAQFRGNVRVTHPRMTWASETLDVDLPKTGGQVETMLAQRQVAFELVDDKGQKIRGRGDQAVYNYSVSPAGTNDVVQLVGSPAVLETEHGTNRNKIIILDRVKQQIITPGDYKIATTLKAARTNAFVLPNLNRRK